MYYFVFDVHKCNRISNQVKSIKYRLCSRSTLAICEISVSEWLTRHKIYNALCMCTKSQIKRIIHFDTFFSLSYLGAISSMRIG